FIQGGDSVYIDGSTGSLPAATVLAANKVTIQDDFTPGGLPDPETTDDSLTIAVSGIVNAPQTEIEGSDGGATFDLQGTLYANVSLRGRGDNDTIKVRGGSIQGSLTVNAGGGSDNRLIIDDSGNTTTSRNVTVTNSSVTGLGPGPIYYSATGGSFNDPNGNDGISITSSAIR